MIKNWHLLIGLFVLIQFAGIVQAEPIPISRVNESSIGQYAEIFFEPSEQLSVDEVQRLFAEKGGVYINREILNFGVDAPPHWLKFVVDNSTNDALLKVFSVESAWLDDLQLYFYQNGERQAEFALGDNLVQPDRPIDSRFFVVEHLFKPGETSIFLRVKSTDPMLLPIFLNDRGLFNKRFELEHYRYGLFYGVLAALFIYKLLQFISLHNAPQLFYCLYLLSFMSCHIAYTGHGFRWLWPQAVYWQQWANPVLIIVTGISGLLFASSFFQIHRKSPRLYGALLGLMLIISLGLGVAYYFDYVQAALKLAFGFVMVFTVLMVSIGILAFRAGYPMAQFFLLAVIIAGLSSAITTMTVSGVLPYSFRIYQAVDLGMLIQFLILALALAEQYRLGVIKHLRKLDH